MTLLLYFIFYQAVKWFVIVFHDRMNLQCDYAFVFTILHCKI